MENDYTNNIDNESEYIIIPNPIYDVVFRYLMEDVESAKIVISTLINEKIISLEMQPLTHSEKKDTEEYQDKAEENELSIKNPSTQEDIRLFHLDFKAIIELADGSEELVMIELQKASEPNDIFRFKRYISRNFQQKQEKEVVDLETQSIKIIQKPIRLIPIFILNFRIENEINDLLIKTSRVKEGVFKDKTLTKHNEFIDNLSYDIYVVQLPNLQKITEEEYKEDEYKSKLYALLKLFDQKSKVKNNEHRLRIIRRFFPDFMQRVVRRLQAADINNPSLEEKMFAEDEYLQALIEKENKITFFKEKSEKAEALIAEQNKEISKKDEEINKKDEEINKKDEEINKNKNLVLNLAKFLKSQNIPIEEIAKQTGLSIQQINDL